MSRISGGATVGDGGAGGAGAELGEVVLARFLGDLLGESPGEAPGEALGEVLAFLLLVFLPFSLLGSVVFLGIL
jgi:hypothetical protein